MSGYIGSTHNGILMYTVFCSLNILYYTDFSIPNIDSFVISVVSVAQSYQKYFFSLLHCMLEPNIMLENTYISIKKKRIKVF